MPDVLRALAGEHEHAPAARRRATRRRHAAGVGAPSRAAARAGASRQTTARRCSNAAAADLQRVGDVGERRSGVRRQIARRAAGRRASSARLRRAPTAPAAAARARPARGRLAGASSRITCALVPPMPNELTPAPARPCRRACHGRSVVLTKNGLAAKSIFGFGVSKCRLRRDRRRARAPATVLIRPATPAAASRWPMLVLTEPMAQ